MWNKACCATLPLRPKHILSLACRMSRDLCMFVYDGFQLDCIQRKFSFVMWARDITVFCIIKPNILFIFEKTWGIFYGTLKFLYFQSHCQSFWFFPLSSCGAYPEKYRSRILQLCSCFFNLIIVFHGKVFVNMKSSEVLKSEDSQWSINSENNITKRSPVACVCCTLRCFIRNIFLSGTWNQCAKWRKKIPAKPLRRKKTFRSRYRRLMTLMTELQKILQRLWAHKF